MLCYYEGMVEKQVLKKEKTNDEMNVKVYFVLDEKYGHEKICGNETYFILMREMYGFNFDMPKEDGGLLQYLKDTSAGYKKIAVLFTDSPCILRSDILDAIDSELPAVSFGRSFVVDTAFLSKMADFDVLKEFELPMCPRFLVIKSEKDMAQAIEIFQERILKGLKTFDGQDSGIEVEDCYIDFNVSIDEGARLANSQLIGNCNIGQSIILSSVIENSMIASGVTVENCVLKNCTVMHDVKNRTADGETI